MADLNFQNPVPQVEFSLESIVPESEEGTIENETPEVIEEEKEVSLDDMLSNFKEEGEEETSVEEVEAPAEEVSELEASAPSIANFLESQGLLTSIPEDVNLEEFDQEALIKTLKYNQDQVAAEAFSKGGDERVNQLVKKISPLTQKIMSYNLDNPNADESDILAYVSSINNSNYISALDPEKNPEAVVREYYKATGEWEKEEIEQKIALMVEKDTIAEEAKLLKPKLDVKAAAIVSAKEAEVKQMKEFELQMAEGVKERTVTQLKKGNIKDIPLTEEDASFLFQAMTTDVTLDVKGKKVEMGYAEGLVRYHKYSDKGDPERLMLGLLVMEKGPEAILAHYAKKAKTQEAEKMIKQTKFSNNKKLNAVEPENKEMGIPIKFNL